MPERPYRLAERQDADPAYAESLRRQINDRRAELALTCEPTWVESVTINHAGVIS